MPGGDGVFVAAAHRRYALVVDAQGDQHEEYFYLGEAEVRTFDDGSAGGGEFAVATFAVRPLAQPEGICSTAAFNSGTATDTLGTVRVQQTQYPECRIFLKADRFKEMPHKWRGVHRSAVIVHG